AHAELGYRDGRAELALRGALGDGRVDGRASVPVNVDLGRGAFTWDERAHGEAELRIDDLDRRMLAPFVQVPEEALLELDLRAQARGTLTDFRASLEAHGRAGHRSLGGAPLHITAKVDPDSQVLRLRFGPHKSSGELAVRAELGADIVQLVHGEASAGDVPLTASLRARDLDVRSLQGLMPPTLYEMQGLVNGRFAAKGTLGDPAVDGRVELRGGSITVLALQQRIDEIALDLRASGRRLVLERLTAESGRGRLSAIAAADLPRAGGIELTGEVRLHKFPMVRPGLPQMQIDSHIKTQMEVSAEATEVNVQVHDTRVAVTGYTIDPPKPIPDNPYVDFRGAQELVPVASSVGAVSAENELRYPTPDEQELDRRFALTIKLADPVVIRGPAIEMTWTGAVKATSAGERREVSGELTASEGRFDLLGNSFRLVSGHVTLPEDEGTVDPFVNIVARTSTPAAEVTATFKGRLSHPQLTFSSNPAMSQSQILTLLLTGTPDASEADQQRVLAQAAALLATFENPALANFLSGRLGIDRVGLSFGDNVDQPILSVGKHLTERLYVETAFQFNAPRTRNRVEARVEFDITPHWMLQTYFGDAAIGGVNLFWHRVFGRPKPLSGASEPAPEATGPADSARGDAHAPSGGGSDGGGGAR
ncbi:MAG: translocation/assembly module TamB domain-containing protein, partial [Nannocystis sp.]